MKEWTDLEWKYTTRESREPRGVEEAGCKIYSGAPTVSQTMRRIRSEEAVRLSQGECGRPGLATRSSLTCDLNFGTLVAALQESP